MNVVIRALSAIIFLLEASWSTIKYIFRGKRPREKKTLGTPAEPPPSIPSGNSELPTQPAPPETRGRYNIIFRHQGHYGPDETPGGDGPDWGNVHRWR